MAIDTNDEGNLKSGVLLSEKENYNTIYVGIENI